VADAGEAVVEPIVGQERDHRRLTQRSRGYCEGLDLNRYGLPG